MNTHSDENGYIAVYPQSTQLGTYNLDLGFGKGVWDLNSWNDLSCGSSPSPDGPTCIPGGGVIEAINALLPEECQDAHQCNICNCLPDDVGFIDFLLDELESKYCIDRSRVYSTGLSNGAMMTQRLGCELNHRLAAIAPQIGQAALGFNCDPKYDVSIPILNIWGTNDTITPGETIVSSFGSYRTPVSHVMYRYGEHNQCNVNGGYVNVSTVSDGIDGWQCIGYDGCNFDGNETGNSTVDVVSCAWDAGHAYPIVNGENIANNVIWNFFQKYSKNPDQISISIPRIQTKSRNIPRTQSAWDWNILYLVGGACAILLFVFCCSVFAYFVHCRRKQSGYQGVNPEATSV